MAMVVTNVSGTTGFMQLLAINHGGPQLSLELITKAFAVILQIKLNVGQHGLEPTLQAIGLLDGSHLKHFLMLQPKI
jgi:hypothetical protein